jgi:phenylpropionate dioxygenase-like ring-hydroxylating dioxygenase large terminal subunit
MRTAKPGMFLRDDWYVGAWSDEVSGKPLARTILGDPIVLYRKADGKVVALEDRCAHRRLPLSMGTVIGDTIQCAYHGLVYDCAGRCIKIPGQDGVPGGARIRFYPVVEQNQFVSIWMGDPAQADESAAVSFPRLADARCAHSAMAFAPRMSAAPSSSGRMRACCRPAASSTICAVVRASEE